MSITRYGPGDEITWPACTGHPMDPRTPDPEEWEEDGDPFAPDPDEMKQCNSCGYWYCIHETTCLGCGITNFDREPKR